MTEVNRATAAIAALEQGLGSAATIAGQRVEAEARAAREAAAAAQAPGGSGRPGQPGVRAAVARRHGLPLVLIHRPGR